MTDTPAKSWVQRVSGHEKFADAAKAGFQDVKNIVGKDATMGQRGVGFARVGGVGVGAYMAGDALFSSKTVDGEDRSMLARIGQFLLGGGVAVGSLIVGKGR